MTPQERINLMAQAASIESAREATARSYGITAPCLSTLAAFYAMQETGGKPRSKAVVAAGLYSQNAIAQHTTILRAAGLVERAPGTNKGVRVTTAGKLACNAYSREIARAAARLLK